MDCHEAWKALGLDPPVTAVQVKRTYRMLALHHHPDKGGDAMAFESLQNVYKVAMSCVSGNITDETDHTDDPPPIITVYVSLYQRYHGCQLRVPTRQGWRTVDIPRGVPDGTLLSQGRYRVQCYNDTPYKIVGHDLVTDCTISLYEALTGFTKTVTATDHPRGVVEYTFPTVRLPCTTGSIAVIDGYGMPIPGRPHEFGALRVRFVVRFPESGTGTPSWVTQKCC